MLVYLLIGPCVEIPRTASTSFEMILALFISSSFLSQMIYAFLFFVLAGYAALYLNHLKDLFGKIIAPILMGILFLGTIFVVPFSLSLVTDSYANNAFVMGFIEG